MILVVDIGNSQIKTGLFNKDQLMGKFIFGSDAGFESDRYFEAIFNFLSKLNFYFYLYFIKRAVTVTVVVDIIGIPQGFSVTIL